MLVNRGYTCNTVYVELYNSTIITSTFDHSTQTYTYIQVKII
jgi:hypothetical protein